MRQIKDTLISLCYAVVLIAAVSFAMCGVARCSRPHSPAPMPVGDTVRVTVYDTLTVVQPAPAEVAQLPAAVKRLPRWTQRVDKNTQGDSALTAAVQISSSKPAYPDTVADSVAVIVPMERKTYTDSSTYRAVISGAWASLDTMEVYPRREIVTIKQPPDRRRWGVSLTAGYGWAGKWTPFVGVGVSYNLFRF